jgi:hypothetical protein
MTSKAVVTFEDKKEDIVVKDFGGVNLSAHRTGIGKDEFGWLENLIPLGHSNMPVIPGPGTTAALSFAVPNASLMFYANINLTDFLFVIKTDGSLTSINLATGAIVNNIYPAATFDTATVGIAQWKNERIIIVDKNNYRSWDQNFPWANGMVIQYTVTSGGAGYTTIPTVTTTGGGGLGANGLAFMQLNGAQAVTAGGTGYTVGDILTLVGGGAGQFFLTAKVRVETLGGAGAVASVSIYTTGSYSVLPTAPIATTGGTGTGCTITPLWNVGSIIPNAPGTVPYITAPTVVFTGGGFSAAATATCNVILGPVPATGATISAQTIATFAGRVWVGNNRTVNYSAPDSWFDFSAATAGGSFVMSEQTLEKSINQLVAANNFLYIVGDTSIDTVSDVRVGTGPVTLFSKVNISAQIGSQFGQKNPLIAFGKALLFSARFGIYSVAGATPRKISDKLDLLMKAVTNAGSFLGAGVCKLYGVLVPVFLVSYADGSVGGTRTLMIALYQGRWFFVTQRTPTLLAGATVSGDQRIYASDGTNIYQVFGETTNATSITWKAVTALWPAKTPVSDKQVFKCGVEVSPIDNSLVVVPGATTDVPITINVDLDNERGSQVGAVVLNNFGQWVNAAGVVGSWVNAGGAVGDWLEPGFNILQQDAQTKGRYVGYTLRGTTQGFTINGILGQIEERAKWNASGVGG